MTNHKLDTDTQVFFYEQEFYVFSNFSSFRLVFEGIDFDTAEHAYHYQKFKYTDPGTAYKIRTARSAHEAFQIAQEHKKERHPHWNEIKDEIMRHILIAKIQQHEYVRRKLLQTGDRELIEDSWRDDYWGWGPNKDGQNKLGKEWMYLRHCLREELKNTSAEIKFIDKLNVDVVYSLQSKVIINPLS